MTYDQLVDFVQNRMRMSHVYQPVMLAALLAHGGKCSTAEIARAILAHDESQVEYFCNSVQAPATPDRSLVKYGGWHRALVSSPAPRMWQAAYFTKCIMPCETDAVYTSNGLSFEAWILRRNGSSSHTAPPSGPSWKGWLGVPARNGAPIPRWHKGGLRFRPLAFLCGAPGEALVRYLPVNRPQGV